MTCVYTCILRTLHYPSLLPINLSLLLFFFFNDTATTEIYTLSLHDALPIWPWLNQIASTSPSTAPSRSASSNTTNGDLPDRKSTRLNSSHTVISYAVFCLKKKKKKKRNEINSQKNNRHKTENNSATDETRIQ